MRYPRMGRHLVFENNRASTKQRVRPERWNCFDTTPTSFLFYWKLHSRLMLGQVTLNEHNRFIMEEKRWNQEPLGPSSLRKTEPGLLMLSWKQGGAGTRASWDFRGSESFMLRLAQITANWNIIHILDWEENKWSSYYAFSTFIQALDRLSIVVEVE